MTTALGATQVDQHAGERPWSSPDHLPPPGRWEPSSTSRWVLYIGVGLVLVALALLLLFA